MDAPLIGPDDELRAEEAWCVAERARVTQYLAVQRVVHGAIGDWPAWHVTPHVAIWAVESVARPGWIGWWAISGDVPLDYISAADIPAPQHPRKAIRAIASRWRESAETSLRAPSTEHTPLTPDLAQQLKSRAELLLTWSDNAALWDVD